MSSVIEQAQVLHVPADVEPSRGEAPRLWAVYGGAVLASLTLPAVKIPVGFDLRIGQLLMAGVFGLVILRDLQRQEVRWGPLLAIVGGGLVLSGLSTLSTYPKVKELTFLVKYLVVFPTAFYLGARLLALAGPRRTALAVELTLLGGCLLAVGLDLHPVPLLVHERPAYLSVGLKGSFWEQGELAFFAGLFTTASLGLRLEHGLRPRSVLPLAGLYGLALGCALASMNKTVWVALFGTALGAGLLYRSDSSTNRVVRRWARYLIIAAVAGSLAIWAYNAWLPAGDKLVTAHMLEHKWQAERGAALRIALSLIGQAPWLGHGFGFVEAYFGSYPTDVIGLGSGVAQLFNSYLDLWLSVGVPGLLYAFGLLGAAVSRRSLVALLIVGYLFIFANVNPVAQHEYYFLVLGFALAAARGEARTGMASASREAPWTQR